MKRIVSLLLALSMVLSMFTVSFAGTSLKDIEGKKYQAAVEALVELGVVSGYPDGTYLPDNVVTRAELAKLLVVAYGLETAAESAKGVTPFADVNAVANHWASGYINVSADYKFVNGYPDGSFKGDATVTYAEAITMCLRVLGYANEIERVGTWPTNYIAKAQDLKLMKDIEFKSYNDGAKRGDIAILIWNMLRTNMWTVTGESEGDGLHTEPNTPMINVKFEDYKYLEDAKFYGYTISADSKEDKAVVKVSLILDGDQDEPDADYEYAKNDFYKFVPETEVEVLINTDDRTLLTMVATGEDKLAEGTLEELDDADYTNLPTNVDYAYVRLNKKAVVDSSTLVVKNEYVDEVTSKKDGVKVNKTTFLKFKDFEDDIVLRNGERVEISDIKEGDVLSKVTNGTQVFYVIGSSEVEGVTTKYVRADSKVTVDGKEYLVDDDTTYIIDPEDEDEKAKNFVRSNELGDMKDEDVRLILDPVVGKIVRIEFDGHIGENTKDTTYKFFAIMNEVERESSRVYTVTLKNEDGEDDYTFAKASDGKNWYNSSEDLTGRFAAVKLNDDNEIVSIEVIADADGDRISGERAEFKYDLDKNYSYVVLAPNVNAKYDKDEEAILNATDNSRIFDVDKSVVVVTLLKDDKDTQDTTDDEYSVEFTEGLAEIEDLKDERVLVVYDDANKYNGAKYVVLFDEVSTKSDTKAGKLDSYVKNEYGNYEATIIVDGEEDVAITESNEHLDDVKVVVYTTEEKVKNDKTKVILKVKATLDAEELSSGEGDMRHGYIASGDCSKDGKKATITKQDGSEVEIRINEPFIKDNDDKTFVLVTVNEASAEEKEDEGADYVVESVEIISLDEVRFEEDDRISGDLSDDVIFIIRGMDSREG